VNGGPSIPRRVFSSITDTGWIHSVPVHFLPRDGEMRIVAEGDSVKYSEYRRSGRATLCVATTVQAGRRYVSAGLPRRGAPPGAFASHLSALWRNAGGSHYGQKG
jgi:hypothetical protein